MISGDGHVEGVVGEAVGSYRHAGPGEPGPDPYTASIEYYDSAGRFRRELGSMIKTILWNDNRGLPVIVLMPTQVV